MVLVVSNFSSSNSTHGTQIDICVLSTDECDEIFVQRERYNVTDINATHVSVIISTVDNTRVQLSVSKGSYAVWKRGKMLLVCAEEVHSCFD